MSDSHATHAAGHDEHPPVPYFVIFGTLVVFTIVTILASYVDLHSKAANVALAFAIAAFKASLVMLFFMHLKYEKRPIILIALAPFALVGMLIMALMPDIANGQYHSDPVETTQAVPATTAAQPAPTTTAPAVTAPATTAGVTAKPETK